jgi:NAD dependent epimerase/dehydratase family enzyme
MLLGGVRTLPTKLLKSGFNFLHPSIEEAITSAVKDNI